MLGDATLAQVQKYKKQFYRDFGEEATSEHLTLETIPPTEPSPKIRETRPRFFA